MSLCGNDKRKAKLSYLFMFTQVGSPCIYYGGEIGMDGQKGMGLELNRKCMIWDEDKQDLDFRTFIQKLIRLRQTYPECNQPYLEWLDIDHPHVVAFRKGALQIVLNNSDEEVQCSANGLQLTLSPFGYEIRDVVTQEQL
jgi:glycosidase